jgi:hypothetical protein
MLVLSGLIPDQMVPVHHDFGAVLEPKCPSAYPQPFD